MNGKPSRAPVLLAIPDALRKAAASVTEGALSRLRKDMLRMPKCSRPFSTTERLQAWVDATEKHLVALSREVVARQLDFDVKAAPVRAYLLRALESLKQGNCEIHLGIMASGIGLRPTDNLFRQLMHGLSDSKAIRTLRARNIMWQKLREAINAGYERSEIAKMLHKSETWVKTAATEIGLKSNLNRNNRHAKSSSPKVQARRQAVVRLLREGNSVQAIARKLKVSSSTVSKDQRAVEGAIFV